jgi:NAD(P)-dependent dehydrogenase (short-subunit alcohol dehydrogenase family)
MPDKKAWTASDIPDLSGKTIVVTGGNSGIGYEAALEFARKRADVILACRELGKARTAAAQIAASASGAKVEVMELDLSNLASVRGFSDAFHLQHQALHVLCNNAGVMAIPYRQTADGFEMQFGTNHLGHFALTGLLLDRLLVTEGARVVNVASGAHRMGKIRFDDLQWNNGYRKWMAYGQSKLANLLFTLELQRKLDAAGKKLLCVACHPGYAATNLQAVGPKMSGSSMMEYFSDLGNRLLAQSAAMGALPTEYAAVAPDVHGGDYIGPDGMAELWGNPVRVGRSAAAQDGTAASRLWEVSEQLTNVHYAL